MTAGRFSPTTAASDEEGFNYLAPDGPERLMAAKVTWEWFNVFGVRPLVGRVFQPEEDQPNANQVAVLAYDTWQRRFGGDPAIVGKSIQLNHQDYRVVGVMGPDFDWPRRAELWVPLGLAPSEYCAGQLLQRELFRRRPRTAGRPTRQGRGIRPGAHRAADCGAPGKLVSQGFRLGNVRHSLHGVWGR